MSKGLEVLERVRKAHNVASIVMQLSHEDTETIKAIDTIEKELKEKEKQDHYIETLEDRLNNVETTYARYKKVLNIIKECLVSEFKLFEKEGEYFILFYFDETHELTFKLKNKEEYDLLRWVLA